MKTNRTSSTWIIKDILILSLFCSLYHKSGLGVKKHFHISTFLLRKVRPMRKLAHLEKTPLKKVLALN